MTTELLEEPLQVTDADRKLLVSLKVARGRKIKPITLKLERKLRKCQQQLLEVQRAIIERNPAAADIIVPPAVGDMSIEQMVAEYRYNRHDDRKGTEASVKACLGIFLRFSGFRRLSRELVEDWIGALHQCNYSPGYKWKLGCVVRTFVRWCAATKRVRENYHEGIRIPKQPMQLRREPFSREEVERIMANLKYQWQRDVIIIAWHTGMAIGDACNMTWGEVDADKGVITKVRRKTGKPITYAYVFGGELDQLIRRRLAEETHRYTHIMPGMPVITKAFGMPRWVKYELRHAFAMANIKSGKTFHNLRATLISDLSNGGVPWDVARCITGITSPRIYAQYATINIETIRKHVATVR